MQGAKLRGMLERRCIAATKPAGHDDGRLTDAQIAAIRAMEPQDFTPTRSFVELLNR